MVSRYQERQIKLLFETSVFNNDKGGGCFRGCEREFMLINGVNNFYPPIATKVQHFFAENNI